MASAAERQVSLLESINQQMAENKAAIVGLSQQMAKGDKRDKQTSAEEAKERLKKPKAPGAGTAIGKKESVGQMATEAKSKGGGGLLKMLGLGAIGASLGLAFEKEIIGGFQKGMTELFGGKDSLLGGAVSSITGLLDNLENPLGALATGLTAGLSRVTSWIDKTISQPIVNPDKVAGATRTQTTTQTTTPDPDKGPNKPDKPQQVARTAQQTRIENDDRARRLSDSQKAKLQQQGIGVKKDGTLGKLDPKTGKFMTKGGGVSAAEGKKLLDDVGADKASAKAVKMADAVEAPKARASAAKVVGPGAAPAATSQAEVDKRMAAKPGGGGAAPAAQAAPAEPAVKVEEKRLVASSSGAAPRPRPNAFIKVAKKIGAALKNIYQTVLKFVAKAGKYSGIKWIAKLGVKALGPIAALITLFMLGKNELDPSISDEERLKKRFAILGEAAGGVLGGVIGALLLTLVFPLVGTLIGGMLGGIIGAFIGGNLGIFLYKCCKDGVVETLKATFKSMKDLAKAAYDYMKQKGFKGIVEDASELIGKGADYVANLASSAAGAVADAASATYDAAAEAASQVKDYVGGKVSAAADAIKESAVGKGVAAAAGAVSDAASAVGSKVSGAISGAASMLGFGPDKPLSPEEKMAKLDEQISDLEKDVAEDSFWESKANRKEDEEKLAALKKRREEMKAMKAANKEAVPVMASGPEGQAAGAQALGDAAAMEAAMSGGGGTEAALASIVEQNAQTSQAIVAALAKLDAKASGGGGNGIPMMIPGGDSAGQGGLGRKTVIGAPL
tara:strand:+ start:6888 stop:9251 length:2364 start_codon:yes stop_codon:yes gene_type:complete